MLIGFCAESASIWRVLGWIVYILKIVIPLLLIILGMVDLGKAVVSSDEKAINKAVTTLIKRFIAAVVVFFVPTIVDALFSAFGVMTSNERADYLTCAHCITNPANCDVSKSPLDLSSN